ncbi:NTP pyrophosphohydrolase [Halovivax ruber XH-70]|uniref:NTP pyrophosphohydrolase n=1 Tax=Halovivax ruber (strain DSM 18193 / JCM 13892 / XH-70) TaxID=797302 RepID=L0I8E7_HALRX|nr:CoA pyrophosphatase [Halovivax ruber]AGB15840.1 NTP pyrophosphohydrolase [Halovivax ruber XH-70]
MDGFDIEPIARHSPTSIDDQPSDAAVLVPIIDRPDGPALLFTKRAEHLGEHPGQMSFPGGGVEPEDDTLRDTALREAHEEIGLDPAAPTVIGRLDDISTITGYAVTPFVARVPDREYEPDDGEVAEIVVISLSELLDPATYTTEVHDHPIEGPTIIHYFHVGEYTVWGATARILVQFLDLGTDFQPTTDVDRVDE